MNVLITLAGQSKRFYNAGYKKPKFLLPIGNSTVISEVVKKFDDNDTFHFVLTEDQVTENHNLKDYIKSLRKNIHLNIIKSHNLGPVYSALQAKSIRDDSSIIISYCDFLIVWDYKKFKREIYGYDGAIVSFKGFHPSSFTGTLYCYLKIKNKLITELREKKSFTTKPSDEFASTGIYYFKNFDIFKKNGYRALEDKKMVKKYKEIYVSLPYMYLLNEKTNILNFEVKRFVSLGTPKDYEEFIHWLNFFKKNA
jgi:NDP-sugar pyrophosphorylase family protein|tara:strand:+ start:232 stop:990 length:759 start_codon:yes stop_codon:yes gene_type:complete